MGLCTLYTLNSQETNLDPPFYRSIGCRLGPKKYQNIARMYDRTGLSTKCTLKKNGFKNVRTGVKAKLRPFVDALVPVVVHTFI